MGLGAISPIHLRKQNQSGDRSCQLKVAYFNLVQASNDTVVEFVHDDPPVATLCSPPDNDLVQVAFQFGKFLQSLPSKSATASQTCKSVYESYPSSREILARHGRLCGLVKTCPYLQLDGAASGRTYVLSLNQTLFDQVLH